MKKLVFSTIIIIMLFLLSNCVSNEVSSNKPPKWSSIPDQEIEAGETIEVDLTKYVTDPEGDDITIILITTGKGVINNGIYNWTPTASDVGTHEVTVEAQDEDGNQATATFNIIVRKKVYVYGVGPEGLIIFNLSDPDEPKIIGNLDTPGSARSVDVTKDYAYIADGGNGLVVADITDPTRPQQVGHLDTVNSQGIYVSGSYAYVADWDNGLIIVDITEPATPQQAQHFYTYGNARNVYVSGNHAYLADDWAGLVILDITDPTRPQQVGRYITNGNVWDVYVSGNYAYLADSSKGLVVLDITEPTKPLLLCEMPWITLYGIDGF